MSKFEEFINNVGEKIEDYKTLSITTVMGKMTVQEKGEINFTKGDEVEGVVSHIDLMDGDIKTMISEPFYKKYPELVQFHQSRELKGQEIIEANINTLKSICTTIGEIIKKDE